MASMQAFRGSPALWLVLLASSAVAAACGSSDSHRQSPEAGGGDAGVAGAAGGGASPMTNTSGDGGASPSSDGGAAAAPAGLAGASAELGGASNDAGAGGAAGNSADGCLSLYFGSDLATVQVPDLTIPDFGSAGTIELWILPDAASDGGLVGDGGLFNKWVSFQEDKFFYVNGDGSVSVYFAQQAANFSSSTAAVTPSHWQHVALAYDTTSARIYVDGVKVGEQVGATAPVNSNGNIQIGHIERDGTHPALHGFYSEARLSSVARYTANFTPAPHLLSDADTTGLWKLDEGQGELAADSSALGNPGTIAGAEWQLAPCR
jgi:hypothetical protein